MALKKCKECGAEISSSATACPKCGAPSTGKTLQDIGCSLILIPIFIIILVLVILFIASLF
jgi:RNA polymerase subunit RPABC4/transcription elongation factor Spt4